MELHFQIPLKPKKKKKTKGKFVGVRQRPSGRWVAEIKDTTQKIRVWLGTFETAEEAARAYDEAACLLRGAHTPTNFAASPPAAADSPLASRILGLLTLKKQSKCCSPNPPAGAVAGPEDWGSRADVALVADEDEVQRPCFSGCGGEELELEVRSPLPLDSSWLFECLEPVNSLGSEMSVFERMKVERQFSASLYAMNGVQECLEMVQAPSAEGLWDLPALCNLSST